MDSEQYRKYMYGDYDPSEGGYRILARQWKCRQKRINAMRMQFNQVREKYVNKAES